MGFAPLAIGTGIGATALGSYQTAAAQRQSAQALKVTSEADALRLEKESKLLREETSENTYRARLNALGNLGEIRADSANSNLASTGTGAVREMALASRLEQEINDKATLALRQATLRDDEARMKRFDGQARSLGMQSQARGSLLSGFGQMASSSSRFVKVKE